MAWGGGGDVQAWFFPRLDDEGTLNDAWGSSWPSGIPPVVFLLWDLRFGCGGDSYESVMGVPKTYT